MLPALPGPEGGDDGGEVDRISALPEDLLRRVLINLKCARQAARTSVLARNWRGLWTDLPEYDFHGINPEAVESALERVTSTTLDYLRIKTALFWTESPRNRASTILRAAARLSPVTVNISLCNYNPDKEEAAPIELPCFDRTSTLILEMAGVPFAPPPAGVFSMLEVLELSTDVNISAALLPSCPRLRVLRILAHRQLKEVTVHSTTLEELEVGHDPYSHAIFGCSKTHQIDIDAPELKKSMIDVEMAGDFSLTFSAPKVDELGWKFYCFGNVGLGDYRLMFLNYYLKEGVRTLDLAEIYYCPGVGNDVPDRSFAEEIRPAIRVLKVEIEPGKVDVDDEEEEVCPQDCPCRQPIDWKDETIALFDLEDVFITCVIFKDGEVELDLLKLLFRSAPGLKSMRLEFNIRVELREELDKKIQRIFKENPHVKCEAN